MADYQDIKGLRVKYLSADPSVTVAGEVWYNSTTGTLRSRLVTEAWSSGAPLPVATYFLGGSGTQTAGLAFGGWTPAVVSTTSTYDGTGWASDGSMNLARADMCNSCAGPQTSTITQAGEAGPGVTTAAESYNGTSWTSENTSVTASGRGGAGASEASALMFGGMYPAYVELNNTESFDGTNWSAENTLTTARTRLTGVGTETAALAIGGGIRTGPPYAETMQNLSEEFNGTSWTEGNNLNTARATMAGFGLQTAAVIGGGNLSYPTSLTTATETYDGTSWSTSTASLATAKTAMAGSVRGTSDAGMLFGGEQPGVVATTEEFNRSANVITAGTWASGTVFPTSSSAVAGAGPRDAALGIGGYPEGSPPTGKSFEYDGTAWSNEATLNPSTGTKGVSAAAGTQTACINAQNTSPAPPFIYTAAGEYDGSSWTNATTRPVDNYSNAACGTQTAGLFFGGTGSPTGSSNATLEYDGTNWTIQNVMGTGRSELAGSGTQTAALGAGGYSNPPPTTYANVEHYNGASWATGGAMITATRNGRSSGTQTDAIFMGGGTPTYTTDCSRYDGTSWSTSPSMATARNNFAAGATSPVAAAWGSAGYYPGTSPNRTNTTEHFNVETSAANIETLTTS